jgi:hypothetical protein
MSVGSAALQATGDLHCSAPCDKYFQQALGNDSQAIPGNTTWFWRTAAAAVVAEALPGFNFTTFWPTKGE